MEDRIIHSEEINNTAQNSSGHGCSCGTDNAPGKKQPVNIFNEIAFLTVPDMFLLHIRYGFLFPQIINQIRNDSETDISEICRGHLIFFFKCAGKM